MEIKQLGPYRLIRELGRGGMGAVYEGVHIETGEPAAIKLLSVMLAGEEGFRERFEGEIETLRKLRHPNIVRLFGFGEQGRMLFYAMELVRGSSLENEFQRGRRFDWREVTRIGIQTCRALRHAHDRGVIHRDIKPGNLLLTGEEQVKLSDFGIARLFGNARLTGAGNVLGTAEFMAPEQAEGGPVGPAADLYSLGGVFYVLLTRRPLFQGQSLPEILKKQRLETPDPVGRHAPDVPKMLESIVARLLQKDPRRRIRNAAVLARHLAALEHGMSLTGTAESGADSPQADSPAADGPADLPSTRIVGDRAELDALPPTRAMDPEDEVRPAAEAGSASGPGEPEQAPPAADDLPETKVTSAFRDRDRAEDADRRQRGGRYTLIAEEDPDRLDTEEVRPPWISPQTWALAAALIAVGLAIWFFLQDPSADALYDRITTRIDGSAESLLLAEDDIRKFRMLYPSDPRARQLLEYETEIELHDLERKLERRARGLGAAENLVPIERDYLEAINYARLDPELGMARLQAIIALYNHRRDTSGKTGMCLELARRRLDRLRRQLDQQTAERLALVQDRLELADRLLPTQPQRAREMYRAVIELYRDKPWAVEAVGRARNALATSQVDQ